MFGESVFLGFNNNNKHCTPDFPLDVTVSNKRMNIAEVMTFYATGCMQYKQNSILKYGITNYM